jgi:hypothetical protein
VVWQDSAADPKETVIASDLRVSRSAGKVTVSAGEATIALGRSSVTVKDGSVDLVRRESGGYGVGALAAGGVDAQVVIPVAKAVAPAETPAANPDKPPPLPVSSAPEPGRGRKRRGAARPAKADPEVVAKARPDAAVPARGPDAPKSGAREGFAGTELLRAALLDGARLVDLALEPGAKVRLEGLRARIRRGEDSLNLGPGVLEVARAGGRLVIDLAPDLRAAAASAAAASASASAPAASAAAPGAAPGDRREETLTFRVSVPLANPSEEIAADVNGGPIWLSSLGVRDGDFGLFDVGLASLTTRSHLVLTADGKTLKVDGEAKVHSLSIKSEALSDEPVAGLELALRLKGDFDLDGARATIADGEVDLGAIRLVLSGDYAHAGEGYRFRGSFDVPLTACQSMLDSTPKGLVPKLQGMRLAGSYALRGRTDVDTAHLDRGFHLEWDASNTCRITEAPAAIAVERFRKPFQRTAYDAEGRAVQLESGPGTPDWVPLRAISKFMETAVLTTEDGGFHRHHGFDHEAIKNSIRENIRKKKFVRGASTISMQLAKNLYLDRGKNLSRKLQEAVLTMYLEQELTKEQILELYLNVVEFGPMVYGIGPAARHYFGASANDLSLGQSLYISSIMPNPKVQHFSTGGAVSESWMGYLRKLMKIARDRDRITDEELDEGLRETVVRGSPAPQRASRPITGPEPDLPPDPVEEWPQ